MKHLKTSIVLWFLILLVFNLGEGFANDDLVDGWDNPIKGWVEITQPGQKQAAPEGDGWDNPIKGWVEIPGVTPEKTVEPEPEIEEPGITLSGIFGPSNFWECILKEIPGTKTDIVTYEVIKKCRNDFPKGMNTKILKKKSPTFGIKTAPECVIKHTKDVSSPKGAAIVRRACYELYPKE